MGVIFNSYSLPIAICSLLAAVVPVLNCSMAIITRPALRADLPRLTEIYNHYVIHTPVTFDLEPYTVERRAAWFEQFAPAGRYRLVVAEVDGRVEGYAGTMRWRPKAAYDTTVETTVYSSPETVGKGLGRVLYAALFDAISH